MMKGSLSDYKLFLEQMSQTYGMSQETISKLSEELCYFWNQDLKTWLQTRHQELQSLGYKNDAIYSELQKEIKKRPFAASPLSLRQIRRIIYG